MTKGSAKPSPPCDRCDAACCRYLATEIDVPCDERDYDDMRWYLLHRNVSILVDHEANWFLAFWTPCEALKDGRCTVYERRPALCREHGSIPGTCEYHGDLFAQRFDRVDELDQWRATAEYWDKDP